jgi:hypothetical protein
VFVLSFSEADPAPSLLQETALAKAALSKSKAEIFFIGLIHYGEDCRSSKSNGCVKKVLIDHPAAETTP